MVRTYSRLLCNRCAPEHLDTLLGTLLARTQKRVKPVREIDPEIPQAPNNIVEKCLATDQGQRYQSVGDILNDLERWQGGSGKVKGLSRVGARGGGAEPCR